MASQIIDIHPHVISDDEGRYPPAPLFGKRSDWSQERPCVVETLIAAMDEAGGQGGRRPLLDHLRLRQQLCGRRLQPLLRSPDRRWLGRRARAGRGRNDQGLDRQGLAGLRIFTGGSTKDFDPSELEDPSAYPAWEADGRAGPDHVHPDRPGRPAAGAGPGRALPNVPIILDHLGRPDVTDGPPYAKAQSLFDLADVPSLYMKLTPRIMGDSVTGQATAETLFPKLVEVFGARAWPGGPTSQPRRARCRRSWPPLSQRLASLSSDDQDWIFGKTALSLYPKLGA
jgi:L-fuconolactonase